jgi:hypothetical protein
MFGSACCSNTLCHGPTTVPVQATTRQALVQTPRSISPLPLQLDAGAHWSLWLDAVMAKGYHSSNPPALSCVFAFQCIDKLSRGINNLEIPKI